MRNQKAIASAALALGIGIGSLGLATPAQAVPASPNVLGEIEMSYYPTVPECNSRLYELKKYDAVIVQPCTWSDIYKWYVLYRQT
ncbi:hypothetical protein [Psychromicrobium sp. YIM B11713]|uniref:hypothetical protein n=1 Tax=Psychromicrobium sp. YIM B11713 TaxID=3145233 RepID=UPI00374EBB56